MTTNELLGDDELLFRHIPGGTLWQKPDGTIASPNFRLRPDEAGYSVSRAAITPAGAVMARLGDPASGSRIAVARVGDIRALGFDVVSVPRDYDLGHAEIRPATADPTAKAVQRALTTVFRYVDTDTPT